MRGKSMSTSDCRPPLLPSRSSSRSATLTYSHVSIYQSSQIQLQLYSTCIKASQSDDKNGPLAVFNNHNPVEGKVILDRSCHHTGRLSICIEGTFNYCSTSVHMNGNGVVQCSTPQRRKYLFFSSSTVIPVSPGINSSSRSVLRDVFIRHKASASSPNVNVTPVDRHFPFAFQLPRSCWPGEQMPPSFTSSQVSGSMSNVFDVSYRIKVVWEATNAIDVPFVLKVPILFYPDHDPRSVVASSENPQSWLEMPLNSDRPMPFRCAVTLPTLVTFPCPSSIPYFVVFTTVPRSPALAREVAADATITVSLVRQVNVTEQVESLSTLPTIPMSASLKSDILRNKLLKRIGRDGQSPVRAMKILEKTPDLQDKPLPPLPNRTFTETTLLQNSMNIGFPKRPRLRFDGRSHPSLEDYAALPDGLYKNKILVSEDVLPSIDCAGLNVKFYLDVSVLVGLDDFRARIPVCLM